jgi:branched-chain amino acid aminotransferase
MFAFVNNQIVPAPEAVVSVLDRGFLYGDGLFETIRVAAARLIGCGPHLARLAHGATRLGICLPHTPAEIEATALDLVQRNHLADGVVRIQVTRGPGTRGYSPQGATVPTLVITTHPSDAMREPPLRWRLHTATLRLGAGDALSGLKTCNRLVSILARAEAEANGADEALLLNVAGEVVEAASANVFWIEHGDLYTPPLASGALPGVTRARVIELAGSRGMRVLEASGPRPRLLEAEGLFLTLSSRGIVEGAALDAAPLRSSPVTTALHRAYLAHVYGTEPRCAG